MVHDLQRLKYQKSLKVLLNKQCSGDIIPTRLFKKCWEAISLFIVGIINTSDQFKTGLSISYITPFLKKHQKNDLKNYRPVAKPAYSYRKICQENGLL